MCTSTAGVEAKAYFVPLFKSKPNFQGPNLILMRGWAKLIFLCKNTAFKVRLLQSMQPHDNICYNTSQCLISHCRTPAIQLSRPTGSPLLCTHSLRTSSTQSTCHTPFISQDAGKETEAMWPRYTPLSPSFVCASHRCKHRP